MSFLKTYDNGLRLIATKLNGMTSVSMGILVQTGSANESEKENGISHFIEHTVFKGTKKRSSFDISDYIDRIGAQINAFTSKELTCFYTKSTKEHIEDCADVLSDIFFDSTFLDEELDKERGVIIEEINMNEDSPEDLCLDILAESYYGNNGLGRTILGPIKNIKRFTREDVKKYMDKYYTADNVVISIAGNIDYKEIEKICDKYFANRFTRIKSHKQIDTLKATPKNLYKYKDIEQAHIAFSLEGISVLDDRREAFNIANTILGGGMSSRLFQRIREQLGLCYTIYSYPSTYRQTGVLEIYAGVKQNSRDDAVNAIIEEINLFRAKGITENEYMRGKEQLKSSVIMGKESTAQQMLVSGKYLLFFKEIYDYKDSVKRLEKLKKEDVDKVIRELFDIKTMSTATLGKSKKPLKI